MIKVVGYVKARLNERSTWAAMTAAVTLGAALTAPYSWIAIALGILGAIIPTSKPCPDGNN